MTTQFSLAISLLLLSSAVSLAWPQQSNGFPPSTRIESRQGRPGEPDVISHQHGSKGTRLECIQVEHHPKHVDDGAACILKFEGGDKYSLKHGESMQAPKESEVYLECAGDKPTRCTVGVW